MSSKVKSVFPETKSIPQREFTPEELDYINSKVDLKPSQIPYSLKLFWAEWRDKEILREDFNQDFKYNKYYEK